MTYTYIYRKQVSPCYGYTTWIDKPWVIIGTGNWFLQSEHQAVTCAAAGRSKRAEGAFKWKSNENDLWIFYCWLWCFSKATQHWHWWVKLFRLVKSNIIMDDDLGPHLLKYGLTPIPAWISNYFHYKVWDEITWPFPNLNSATVDVWERISHFSPHFPGHVITYPCWDISLCQMGTLAPAGALTLAAMMNLFTQSLRPFTAYLTFLATILPLKNLLHIKWYKTRLFYRYTWYFISHTWRIRGMIVTCSINGLSLITPNALDILVV